MKVKASVEVAVEPGATVILAGLVPLPSVVEVAPAVGVTEVGLVLIPSE